MENKMITNLQEQTGKSLDDWIKIVEACGESKHSAVIRHLKSEHGLSYGYANLIAHKAKGSDAGSEDDQVLVDNQYKGKESLRPLYDLLIEHIRSFGDDVELAPKRAYVSLRRKKQFGLIQPSTKTRLDIGINLKGKEPNGILLSSGSWNSMVSHRVKTASVEDISPDVISWLKEAYEAAG